MRALGTYVCVKESCRVLRPVGSIGRVTRNRVEDGLIGVSFSTPVQVFTPYFNEWETYPLGLGVYLRDEDLEGVETVSFPVTRWHHISRNSDYKALGVASVQAGVPIVEGDSVMVYVGEDGKLWVRPEYEFNDGRFQKIVKVVGYGCSRRC
jgi:hypothetical protein